MAVHKSYNGIIFDDSRDPDMSDRNNIICFDTETTGLVMMKMPHTHPNQPFIVSLSGVVLDNDLEEIGEFDFIVRPDGRYDEMPKRAFEAHGISFERACDEGISLKEAMEEFDSKASTARLNMCHNTAFDVKLVRSEFYRLGIEHRMPEKELCTMITTTKLVGIPSTNPYYASRGECKWPTLMELHEFVFGEGFEDAHNSLNDVKAMVRCFKELVNRGHYVRAS